ncbi:recombinase family protein [Ruminococcus sp.]|uniref:recombinase family protein n=1 Tax=Ruminococcus sp. TaxID=41978 RepID=UPI002CC0A7A1|nr:recombinase family protein [Ruminococcus sp.]HNZ99248.1 recombinase family protein [Ruminococcus sp.]HOH85927.1 recombinase family protein [Ruminococcus sp.]
MSPHYSIAGYCRISADLELDRDNTSIENQKLIISDYVQRHFPDSVPDFYEDRDRSGYTFEQREGYQELRRRMMAHEYDILIVKDFSRFSRRNSKGLVELEDLRDAGMRIISIGDNIDYSAESDNWQMISFHFLMNEMPVTDTSRKVKAVVKRRQEQGQWQCGAPYGYRFLPNRSIGNRYAPDEEAAEVVKEIFGLYLKGWGYHRIAEYLTQKCISTPSARRDELITACGRESHIRSAEKWSAGTAGQILQNDFYIGTLRQGKYRRRRINGPEEKVEPQDQLVFEDFHEPLIDCKVFAQVQEQIKLRSRSGYNGIRKYENVYSGCMFCGDCGAPMFSLSRPGLSAYHCSGYHKHGLKVCTSHYIRTDVLDAILKSYILRVRENSSDMLEQLRESLRKQKRETRQSRSLAENINSEIEEAKLQIKLLTRQQARDIARNPERAELTEEVYAEEIEALTRRITGLKNQLRMTADKHNTMVKVSRIAKDVLDIFDSIVHKKALDKTDVAFIVDRITVHTDSVEIKLKADIDKLLRCGTLAENTHEEEESVPDELFVPENTEAQPITVPLTKQRRAPDSINTVMNGDPLRYTQTARVR